MSPAHSWQSHNVSEAVPVFLEAISAQSLQGMASRLRKNAKIHICLSNDRSRKLLVLRLAWAMNQSRLPGAFPTDGVLESLSDACRDEKGVAEKSSLKTTNNRTRTLVLVRLQRSHS